VKICSCIAVVSAAVLSLTANLAAAETVFLVGDSTVSTFSPPDPRNGWGQVIGRNFSADVSVSNFAISGRSSKSFYEEGAWKPVVAAIKPGDYVFIQFGHNDEKKDIDRHTDPYGSYQEYLSRYIDETVKAGGIPVLITPVSRGKFSGPRLARTHDRYPDAVIELGKTKKVPVIDLTALSEAHFNKLGYSETLPLFIASIDNKDDTHFTPAGALVVANLVAQGIKALDIPLARKLKVQD